MTEQPFDVRRRWSATATTWVQKVAALYRQQASAASTDDERWLVGYDAEQVLWRALGDLEALTDLVPVELLDEAHAAAASLANRLRARRLAEKLDGNLSGRTPEEAATFRAKAAALREQGTGRGQNLETPSVDGVRSGEES